MNVNGSLPKPSVAPLRALFDASGDIVQTKKTNITEALQSSPAVAAFFGLPAKVSQDDGSLQTLERVLWALESHCTGEEVSWQEFVEKAAPAALFAAVSARVEAAARGAAALADVLPSGKNERQRSEALAALSRITTQVSDAPEASSATKAGKALEARAAQGMLWADRVDKATLAALQEAKALQEEERKASEQAKSFHDCQFSNDAGSHNHSHESHTLLKSARPANWEEIHETTSLIYELGKLGRGLQEMRSRATRLLYIDIGRPDLCPIDWNHIAHWAMVTQSHVHELIAWLSPNAVSATAKHRVGAAVSVVNTQLHSMATAVIEREAAFGT